MEMKKLESFLNATIRKIIPMVIRGEKGVVTATRPFTIEHPFPPSAGIRVQFLYENEIFTDQQRRTHDTGGPVNRINGDPSVLLERQHNTEPLEKWVKAAVKLNDRYNPRLLGISLDYVTSRCYMDGIKEPVLRLTLHNSYSPTQDALLFCSQVGVTDEPSRKEIPPEPKCRSSED